MAYIYCIINKINGKKYVGKTTLTIKERVKEHVIDSRKDRCKDRPLYRAFNKYGLENFKAIRLKECTVEELDYYEKYYIEKLNTYGHYGYNATKGGDGSILYDYNEVVSLYGKGYNVREVSDIIGCHYDTVGNILRCCNVKIRQVHQENRKALDQYDKSGNFIQTFVSILDAGKWVSENGYTELKYSESKKLISRCANGHCKSAYGFVWKFHTEIDNSKHNN